MKNFANRACSNLRIKYALLLLVGGSFFLSLNTAQAQTQDTTWYSIPTSTSSLQSSSSFSYTYSTSSLSLSTTTTTTNTTTSTSTSTTSTLVYYSVSQVVDDILVKQVSGPTLNFTYTWSMVRWNTGVAINLNGVGTADLANLRVGIVITVDDIREAPFFASQMPADLVVYPNPCQDMLSLKLEGYEPNDMNLNILNIQGEIVYSQTIKAFAGESIQRVSLGDLSPGYYILSLKGKERITKPIQVVR